jgi:hypothetical protein
VLLLLGEVLNFVNRHRGMADGFHAFIQNLTVAVATTKAAAAITQHAHPRADFPDCPVATGRISYIGSGTFRSV